MRKQNNLFALITVFVCMVTVTSGCESKSNAKDDRLKALAYNEEYVQQVNNGKIKDDNYQGSVYRVTSALIDSLQIKILYGSPGVRKRIIWGKLVPYDTVWVSGAIKATAIEFSKDVIIGEKKLKSGKYAFFTIPGRKDWKIVINTDYHQHNASDYDMKKDLLRFDVAPDTLSQPIRRLTYSITKESDNEANITLAWEKLRIAFKVKISEHK